MSISRPHADQKGFLDPHWPQGEYSLMRRMTNAGAPYVTLYEQHRLFGGLGDFPNTRFYRNMVVNGTDGLSHPKLVYMKKFFNEQFEIDGNQVWLDVQKTKSKKEDNGTS